MRVVAIDPGKTGSICYLDEYGGSAFELAPSCISSLWTGREFIQDHVGICSLDVEFVVEDVHSLFGMSAKSNFQFGRNLGFAEALLGEFTDEVRYYAPKAWQAIAGIEFPKGSTTAERKAITREAALQAYPKAALFGSRGGYLDGRGDALMIAHAAMLDLDKS